MTELVTALGLMSGTSLDGIDAALIRTDGRDRAETGPFLTVAYDDDLREALRGCLGNRGPVAEVERAMTEAHARVVGTLLEQAGSGWRPELIGFHGHTLLHAPERRFTCQIGDGARLAGLTGIPVINDFRSADVAAGGQGAPLVPLWHRALAAGLERPLAVLNIGGVANVTWLGPADEAVLAFDTGPGNALIDDWMRRHTGRRCDDNGACAASGRIDETVLQTLLAVPWFALPPPKSLDRDAFDPAAAGRLSLPDGAATLTAFTAAAVARALDHLPETPRRWLVTGGGRLNSTLMRMLSARLAVPVAPVESVGWSGDALEAQAFAYLAVRSRLSLPLSLPGTTGVPAPVCGGRCYQPERD